jgi:hypothetical protein
MTNSNKERLKSVFDTDKFYMKVERRHSRQHSEM